MLGWAVMISPKPPKPTRGWPAWGVTWAAILGSSVGGALLLGTLSLSGARAALEAALADHLTAAVGTADGALYALPIETLIALNGARSRADLEGRIDDLAGHGGLRGLALLGPDDAIYGHGGRWLPLAAERDLVALARGGAVVTGPLYRDEAGELYQTAYRGLTGHAGWVLAVEGSAATLGAVDTLRRTQLVAGLVVIALASLLSGGLALALTRPIRRLGDEIAAASPGSPPDALTEQGFQELRQVSEATRELLAAILARDARLSEAHRREVEQLTRMAAGLAHEVGNPLNAIALSVEQLATQADPARRARVVVRVREQLGELEAIVNRLRDLTSPLQPVVVEAELGAIVDGVEAPLAVIREGQARLRTDPVMVAQILRNLLLNAAAAGAREVRVRVSAEPPSLLVTDDGPGIPPEEQGRIFDWFHTSRAAGSGLGLPMSRRLAEALGGSLELVSARPASFTLRLPREALCSP